MTIEAIASRPRMAIQWSARDWLAAHLGLDPGALEVIDVSPDDEAATYRAPDGRVLVVVASSDRVQRRIWCRIGPTTAEAYISRSRPISWLA
jgi:hypothetical protein